jgi:hypothetical protein
LFFTGCILISFCNTNLRSLELRVYGVLGVPWLNCESMHGFHKQDCTHQAKHTFSDRIESTQRQIRAVWKLDLIYYLGIRSKHPPVCAATCKKILFFWRGATWRSHKTQLFQRLYCSLMLIYIHLRSVSMIYSSCLHKISAVEFYETCTRTISGFYICTQRSQRKRTQMGCSFSQKSLPRCFPVWCVCALYALLTRAQTRFEIRMSLLQSQHL